jgi:hypothetical protein
MWVPATLGQLRALADFFRSYQQPADPAEVVRLYRQVADTPAVPPVSLARAGLLAGTMLMLTGSADQAAGMLADAVRLLPAVAWRGIDRQSRETQLADFSGLGSDAAASQLATGHPETAVEMVEQGRSVLWADMLRLRRGDAELWDEHPEQAARLRDLAAALDQRDVIAAQDHGISRSVDRRMALATEWEQLVAQVRAGHSGDFLQPARLADLLPAAAHGPVVIVNVSQHRCDALLVTSDNVQAVPLPALSAQDVARNTVRYLEAQDAERDREQTLLDVLAWLWDAVAEPVLAALGLGAAPPDGQPWPRLWWCPTGLLSLLPLHAAGHYPAHGDSPPRTVLDRVISSYTPTLGALADATRAPARPARDGTLLVVGLPDTPGEAPLPGASRERDLLAGRLGGRVRVLYQETATTGAVGAELPRHPWAHLSCHGQQNLAVPAQGGLLLYDGTLTVADLSAASHHGEFAFLSACQTATGGAALPDEAISLAAALHYTGFRHVIATLWSVYDRASTEVARQVYGDLIQDGQLVPAGSAEALHAAVRAQRRRHPLTPSWWTPFIHIGP